jgi:uncharacterized membrane protein
MDRNLIKQIKLAKGEKVYYDFNKLSGKNSDCRLVLTSNRVIIYNDGIYYKDKRKIRRKGINEIQRDTITHVEYYIEYKHATYITKLIGFIFIILGLVAGAFNYVRHDLLPELSSASTNLFGYFVYIRDLIYYGGAFIFLVIGLTLILKAQKTLFFRVVSGHTDDYVVELKKNKYNEEAIKRLSTKLYIA